MMLTQLKKVKIRYNGISQWNQQSTADDRGPATCSNIDARGLSADLPSIRKGDPTQREQADKTEREHVTLLKAMGKLKGKLTNEEHEAKSLEEMSNGPLSFLPESVKTHTQVLINCRHNRKL